MYNSTDAMFNLRRDNLELKKELASVRNDNHLLKVKVRKLLNEINKKDQQIETLVDPSKSLLIKKVISEKGASMIITLRSRIQKLEKILSEKDCTIRRLQNDLQTKKLYTIKGGEKKRHGSAVSKCASIPFVDVLNCGNESPIVDFFDPIPSEKSSECSSSGGRTEPRDYGTSKDQYESLSRTDLLCIIKNFKGHSDTIMESPKSEAERCELQCDTPHPEIQQLQNYFMDILSEVDNLKVTIADLKSDQEKTAMILKEKDSSIEHLAKKVELLQRPSIEDKTSQDE